MEEAPGGREVANITAKTMGPEFQKEMIKAL